MSGTGDSVQRALNEAKKQELREKYGAEFHTGNCDLPPEVEGRWLNEIEEFERQFECTEHVTVRRFVGDPPVRQLGEIPSEELEQEVEHLLEILRSNNIAVTMPEEISHAEAYRFLTEELLRQEIADIRISGFTLNFLYEEFHPDIAREATWAAEDFFQAVFERREQVIANLLSADESLDARGAFQSPDILRADIFSFLGDIAVFLDWDAEVTHCTVDGDRALILARVFWTGLNVETLRKVSACGRAQLRLKLSDEVWHVIHAELPGMTPA
jgi:hypothetical protein